jgi:hypothetical protein
MLAESTAVPRGGMANNTTTQNSAEWARPKNHEIINRLLGNLPDANLLD